MISGEALLDAGRKRGGGLSAEVAGRSTPRPRVVCSEMSAFDQADFASSWALARFLGSELHPLTFS